MNFKFVVGGVAIIAALYFGTEKYWQYEFEEQERNSLKNLAITPEMQTASKGLPIKSDILNQYPNIFFYMNFTQDLPQEAEAFIKPKLLENSQKLACGYFSQLPQQDNKYKDKAKAVVSVIEQDNVVMTYIVKNRLGNVLMEHKQVLSQCPEFQVLKLSIA
ncbi:hypothetical protein [Acinetobacter sp. ANC 3882]|uniref:hypothetical protein n=1 Tax=Acinetobacter sp. ANC 3882 TaxID=2923423 RepID=UPI001F4AFE72|nr:hypothetical protein [Acinetobacter sp. ANC 3882]MCH7315162.1 hypothetical protein [Acinetobacter sp. ANC 3882]